MTLHRNTVVSSINNCIYFVSMSFEMQPKFVFWPFAILKFQLTSSTYQDADPTSSFYFWPSSGRFYEFFNLWLAGIYRILLLNKLILVVSTLVMPFRWFFRIFTKFKIEFEASYINNYKIFIGEVNCRLKH